MTCDNEHLASSRKILLDDSRKKVAAARSPSMKAYMVCCNAYICLNAACFPWLVWGCQKHKSRHVVVFVAVCQQQGRSFSGSPWDLLPVKYLTFVVLKYVM